MGRQVRAAWIAAALAAGLISGCARPALDPGADAEARGFFNAVRTGDWDRVERDSSPEVANSPDRRAAFEQVRRLTPDGAPAGVEVAGWSRTKLASPARPALDRTTAVHVFEYPAADLVVTSILDRRPNGGYQVAGFHMSRTAPGMIAAHRFSLSGKSFRHYAYLAEAALIALFMLTVAAAAGFARGLRWRVAWAVLAFVGVGGVAVNWTTGQASLQPVLVSVLGLGMSQGASVSPWTLQFSLPLGAVLVLARLAFLPRSRAVKAAAAAP